MLSFKAFCFTHQFEFHLKLKNSPYAMRSTNNFIENVFSAIQVSINFDNNLHNHVESVNSYVSYKEYIKAMLTNMYV